MRHFTHEEEKEVDKKEFTIIDPRFDAQIRFVPGEIIFTNAPNTIYRSRVSGVYHTMTASEYLSQSINEDDRWVTTTAT